MVVIGHQAVSDYCGPVWLVVPLDQSQTVLKVASVEEYGVTAHSSVVEMVVLLSSECVGSIWHDWIAANLPQVVKLQEVMAHP